MPQHPKHKIKLEKNYTNITLYNLKIIGLLLRFSSIRHIILHTRYDQFCNSSRKLLSYTALFKNNVVKPMCNYKKILKIDISAIFIDLVLMPFWFSSTSIKNSASLKYDFSFSIIFYFVDFIRDWMRKYKLSSSCLMRHFMM